MADQISPEDQQLYEFGFNPYAPPEQGAKEPAPPPPPSEPEPEPEPPPPPEPEPIIEPPAERYPGAGETPTGTAQPYTPPPAGAGTVTATSGKNEQGEKLYQFKEQVKGGAPGEVGRVLLLTEAELRARGYGTPESISRLTGEPETSFTPEKYEQALIPVRELAEREQLSLEAANAVIQELIANPKSTAFATLLEGGTITPAQKSVLFRSVNIPYTDTGTVIIGTKTSNPIEVEATKELEDFRVKNPAQYRLLLENGPDALKEAQPIQTTSNAGILFEQQQALKRFREELEKNYPDLAKIYREGGIEAYQKEVETRIKAANQAAYNTAKAQELDILTQGAPEDKKTIELIAPESGKSAAQLNADVLSLEQKLTDYADKVFADNPNLTKEQKQKIIEDSDLFKEYQKTVEQADKAKSPLSDVVTEILSVGQIDTATFNRKELEQQYETQKKITLDTFRGDVAALEQHYKDGHFGKYRSPEATEAFKATLDIVKQQNDVENAVRTGNLEQLNDLFNKGAFGTDREAYLSVYKYVESGGRELSPITADDLKVVENTYGNKEDYIRDVTAAQPTNFDLAKEYAIAATPIYGTIHLWDKLNPAERIGSIALDVLAFVPIVAGVAEAAKLSAGAGRVARLASGLKAIPRLALAEAKAPFTVLRHPVESAKIFGSEVRNLGEWLVNPKKIPINSFTNTYGTIRLDAAIPGSPESAMVIRDELMRLHAAGERPILQFGDKIYELREPAFLRGNGGLVTASPDVNWAREPGGAVVITKYYPEGHPKAGLRRPETEQGLFQANTPLQRFTSTSAFNLERFTGAEQTNDALKYLDEFIEATANADHPIRIELNKNLIKIKEALSQSSVSPDSKLSKQALKLAKENVEASVELAMRQYYDEYLKKAYAAKLAGDEVAATEALKEAFSVESLFAKPKPGFIVSSPEVSINAVPSGKTYKGMVFSPDNFKSIFEIAENEIKQDRAAQLFLEAESAKKAGDFIKANKLSEEAAELVKGGNSGFKRLTTAEMELKYPEHFQLPEYQPTYYTRSEATGARLEIYTDKPYDYKTVIKSKLLAPIETIQNIYEPAIKVRNIALTDEERIAKITALMKEADDLELRGDLAGAVKKRIEAGVLAQRLNSGLAPAELVRASDEIDNYIAAANKADALGDPVNADRLLREAELIRSERLAGREFRDITARRAGTAAGIYENIRVLGVRPENYYRAPEIARVPIRVPKLARPTENIRYPSINEPERTPEIVRTTEPPRLVEPPPRIPEEPRPTETPRIPDTPRVPEIPRTPEVPRTPETPRIPETPRVPETPIMDGMNANRVSATDENGNQVDIDIREGVGIWIQGRPAGGPMFKIYNPKDGKVYTTRDKPAGYIDNGAAGMGSAEKTFMVVGANNLKPGNYDMGIALVHIGRDAKGEITVDFKRDPKDAYGGGNYMQKATKDEVVEVGGNTYRYRTPEYVPTGITRQQRIQNLYQLNESDLRPNFESRAGESASEIKRTKKKKTVREVDNQRYYRGHPILPPEFGSTLL